MDHHPDRNPDNREAEERFKEAAEAYSVLSDAQKRAAYDRFGHQAVQGAGGAGFDPNQFTDFSDILGEFFGLGDLFGGGQRRRNTPQRGEDLRYDLEIDFENAVFGMTAEILAPRLEACKHCKGKGAEPGSGSMTCPTCRGEGTVIPSPCPTCKGRGAVQNTATITVKIPPGVREGTSLRISGAGQAGFRGGPAGDLFVVMHVLMDKRFVRNGDDLYVEERLSYPQATLGCEVHVETMEEPLTIKIPPGTQNGALFRLRDRGMPKLEGRGHGDQFVKVIVDIPKSLSAKQRELLREYAKTLGEDPAQYDETVLRKIFGRG